MRNFPHAKHDESRLRKISTLRRIEMVELHQVYRERVVAERQAEQKQAKQQGPSSSSIDSGTATIAVPAAGASEATQALLSPGEDCPLLMSSEMWNACCRVLLGGVLPRMVYPGQDG